MKRAQMEEAVATPVKPVKRSRFRQIVLGVILVAIIYFAVTTVWTYERELRIVYTIKLNGGKVVTGYDGPNWLPVWFRETCPIFNRIHEVFFARRDLPARLFAELGSLTSLKRLGLYGIAEAGSEIEHLGRLSTLLLLDLRHSLVSDVEVAQLKNLAKLEVLFLSNTKVSDAGLPPLNALKSLKYLDLQGTETTPEGREAFRRGSPQCKIDPEP